MPNCLQSRIIWIIAPRRRKRTATSKNCRKEILLLYKIISNTNKIANTNKTAMAIITKTTNIFLIFYIPIITYFHQKLEMMYKLHFKKKNQTKKEQMASKDA